MPRVSVLTTVRNGAPYLAAALESVQAQTYRDVEHVVVDDGSTDRTPEVLAAWEAPGRRVVRLERSSGHPAALNAGLAHVQGELVALLDADDVAHPRRLEREVEWLDRHPEISVVGSPAIVIDARGRTTGFLGVPVGSALVRWESLFHPPFVASSVLIRREVVAGHRFDESVRIAEDYDLWTRLLADEDGDNIRSPLVRYRRHPAQTSTAERPEQVAMHDAVAGRALALRLPEVDVPPELVPPLWRLATGTPFEDGPTPIVAETLLALHRAFCARHGDDPRVRRAVAAALARASGRDPRLRRDARALDPLVELRVPLSRAVVVARRARHGAPLLA